MKNQLLIASAIGLLSLSSYIGTSSVFAAPVSHEATGSLTTTSAGQVVTPATLGTVSTISGTTTSASSITVNTGSAIVFAPVGDVRVTIPAATVITPAIGTTFDSTAIISTGAVVSAGLSSNEISNGAVEFGISTVGLNFSAPIKIEIPVPGYTGTTIAIKVKHGGTSTFVTTGLTNDPNTTCTNGIPAYANSTATVSSAVATIYTCAASTFAAVTTQVSTSSTGGGGSPVYYSSSPTITSTTATQVVTSTGVVTKKRVIVRKTPVKRTTVKTPTLTQDVEAIMAEVQEVIKKTPQTKTEVILSKNLYTNSSRVNMYLAADSKAKFLGYLTKNIKVSVTEENGEWIKITTATFSGWAKRSFFRLPTEAESAKILRDADKVIPYVLYTNNGRVNVRLAGDKTAKFLGYFGSNTKVEVIGSAPGWLNVTTKMLTGWSKKADFREPKANEDTTIQIAK